MRVFPSHRQVFKPCDLLVLPLLPDKHQCLHGCGHLAAQTVRQTVAGPCMSPPPTLARLPWPKRLSDVL